MGYELQQHAHLGSKLWHGPIEPRRHLVGLEGPRRRRHRVFPSLEGHGDADVRVLVVVQVDVGVVLQVDLDVAVEAPVDVPHDADVGAAPLEREREPGRADHVPAVDPVDVGGLFALQLEVPEVLDAGDYLLQASRQLAAETLVRVVDNQYSATQRKQLCTTLTTIGTLEHERNNCAQSPFVDKPAAWQILILNSSQVKLNLTLNETSFFGFLCSELTEASLGIKHRKP